MKLYRPYLEQGIAGTFRVVTPVQLGDRLISLWHEIPDAYAPHASYATNNAGLVALLLEAMRCNEAITCEAPVSAKLLRNLRYYMHAMKSLYRSLNVVEIHAESIPTASIPSSTVSHRAMGLSCGVDSLSTLMDWSYRCQQPERKLTCLFFVDAGSHGRGHVAEELFKARLRRVESAAKLIGLPLIVICSNVNEIVTVPFEDSHAARTVSCVLSLEGYVGSYLMASTNSYRDLCPDGSNSLCDQLLSSDRMEVVHDGAQFSRVEKTQRIASWDMTHTHLNVCTMVTREARNCSSCFKCMLTMLALELLGLQGEYSAVFDYSSYRKLRGDFIARMHARGTGSPNFYWRELVDYAAKSGSSL
ncbi:hypothetical protein [Lacipirellula sp.]|uniref:hypothetical protein n=1 Tax=Lacipirellula sp. TaxID=2691419 RepID=UPI003D0C1762